MLRQGSGRARREASMTPRTRLRSYRTSRRLTSGPRRALALCVVAATLGSGSGEVGRAQEDPRRFFSVKEWTGTISMTGSGGGQVDDFTWTINQSITGTFRLSPGL